MFFGPTSFTKRTGATLPLGWYLLNFMVSPLLGPRVTLRVPVPLLRLLVLCAMMASLHLSVSRIGFLPGKGHDALLILRPAYWKARRAYGPHRLWEHEKEASRLGRRDGSGLLSTTATF